MRVFIKMHLRLASKCEKASGVGLIIAIISGHMRRLMGTRQMRRVMKW